MSEPSGKRCEWTLRCGLATRCASSFARNLQVSGGTVTSVFNITVATAV
jgi:hypothetical protein